MDHHFCNGTPKRGLRQGDSLSPGVGVLSRLLLRAEEEGLIHQFKVARNALNVSHLFFADDSFFFCKANLNEAREIWGYS